MRRSHALPTDIAAKLQFLLASQYWDPAQLHHYQWQRLRQLLHHAGRHVPWYRDQFAAAGFVPDDATDPAMLRALPLLTRDTLRTAGEQLLAETVDRRHLQPNYSGGSTGEPVRVYQDAEYRTWAAAARLRAWTNLPGVTPADREALLWGADRDITGRLSLQEILCALLQGNDIQLNTFNADIAAFRRFVRIVRLLRPPLLRGYASSLRTLCDVMETDGLRLPHLRAVISSAETLFDHDRRRFETILGAPVLNSYGCREVSQIATECPCQQGLHVSMETNYVEVVDGQVLVTNLTNYTMPLIRYAVGDLAASLDCSRCSCGRGLVRLSRLRGRSSDTLCFGTRRIHAERIAHLLYGTECISRFQIIKNEPCNRLTILVDRDDPPRLARVRTDLQALLPGTTVTIQVSDCFFPTASGKLALVLDEQHLPAPHSPDGKHA